MKTYFNPDALTEAHQTAGLSQTAVARKANRDYRTVRKALKGQDVKLSLLAAVARTLGCEVLVEVRKKKTGNGK